MEEQKCHVKFLTFSTFCCKICLVFFTQHIFEMFKKNHRQTIAHEIPCYAIPKLFDSFVQNKKKMTQKIFIS